MDRLKLLGRTAAVTSCGVAIGYSGTLVSHGSYLSHTQFLLAGVSIAAGIGGAITVAEDLIRQVVPRED